MADAYTKLARASFEAFTRTGERIAVPTGERTQAPAGENSAALIDRLVQDAPEMLSTRAGCFVSLHIGDDLRGCIGTLAPTQPTLADEIVENAISACSRDPRFPAVRPEELERIHCSVDVLGTPEAIDGPHALDVKRYGVIVSKGFRRGVLLPDLEGVDTIEQQIGIAKQKAGIAQWEDCALERFEVVRHSE